MYRLLRPEWLQFMPPMVVYAEMFCAPPGTGGELPLDQEIGLRDGGANVLHALGYRSHDVEHHFTGIGSMLFVVNLPPREGRDGPP